MWVVLVSLGASFCFAAAVVLQQHAAVSHGANLRLIFRPLWLAGIAVDFAGFLLQLLALHLGGIIEVQVLLTSVLAFGLLLAGARPGHAGWWGIGLLTVVDPLASLVLGMAVGGNSLRGRGFAVLTGLAGLVMVAGIVLLALAKESLATRRESVAAGTA